MEHASHIDGVTHDLVPACTVVFIPREAIDKELLGGPASCLHSTLYQAASDGHGYDLTILDDTVDHVSVFGA